MIPDGLRYHTEHEWLKIERDSALLGITHFAQDALGDIVYVDLPKVGATVTAGQEVGEVESTKTTSAIYSPVSGSVVEVNLVLKDHPEIINQEPYGKGWILKLKLSNPSDADRLMDAKQYGAFLKQQEQ